MTAATQGGGAAAGPPAPTYWGLSFSATGAIANCWTAGDTSGNVAFSSQATDSGVNSGSATGFMVSVSAVGAVNWQNVLYTGASYNRGASFDNSGNLYAAGRFSSNSGVVVKRNPAGALQWQRTFVVAGETVSPMGFWANASGRSVVASTHTPAVGSNATLIVCYDATGAIQWQREISLAGISTIPINNPFIDSSGNVYVCGVTTISTRNAVWLAKYDSAGAIQWQRTIVGASGATQGCGIVSSVNGNVTVVGLTASQGAGGNDGFIASYDSSGAIQWQRVLGNALAQTFRGIIADSSNNIYVVGTDAISSKVQMLLVKYDSTGAIQWQNNMKTTNGCATTVVGIGLHSDGSLLASGHDQGGGASKGYLWKLPADGSLLGTYGIYTYSAAALTDASSTLTDVAGILADGAGGATDAAGSLTDASSSYTTALQTII